MSKQNKVNKSNYDQAGRLTPDDLAREQKKMKKMMPSPMAEHDRLRGKVSQPRHETEDSSGERASSPARIEREESE